MNEILRSIELLRVVPVIKIEDAEHAEPLARALVDGGLPVAEVTFRTEAAEKAIGRIHRTVPDVLLGAGTVLSVDQVKRAVDAGARFIVSPGFNPKVVDYCIGNGIPVTPGVNNPTGVEMGLERGLEVLKFFPAEASGGIALLKAMAAPYVDMRFIPTGGINPDNLAAYLSLESVFACGGSWMVKSDLIAAGDFEGITRKCREAVRIAGEIA